MNAARLVAVVVMGACLAACPPIPGLGEKQPTPAEVDSGPLGRVDAGATDAAAPDAAVTDASAVDASATDAGSADGG